MIRCGIVLAAAALAALAIGTPASATASIYSDYTSQGPLVGCDYSPDRLRNALANVPPDIQQYDPGYVSSLNGALANQASGACASGAAESAALRAAAAARAGHARDGSPAPTAVLAGRTSGVGPLDLADLSSSDHGLPLALAVLVGAMGLLLLSVVVFAATQTRRVANGGEQEPTSRTSLRTALSDYWWGLRDRFRR